MNRAMIMNEHTKFHEFYKKNYRDEYDMRLKLSVSHTCATDSILRCV